MSKLDLDKPVQTRAGQAARIICRDADAPYVIVALMIDKITAYENGEMDDYQMIEFFQELVSSGLIHSLQGSYQRAAQQLINSGLITQ